MLSQKQQLVVESWDRAVLVMAPVGTGKTLTLAQRATRAVTQGMEPAKLLCLSFTNRAAREVKARVQADVCCSTFHALCARILRGESTSLGLPGDFVIYDEEDCTEVLAGILAGLGHDELSQNSRARYAIWCALGEARLAAYDSDPPRRGKESFHESLKHSGVWAVHQVPEFDYLQLMQAYVSTLRDAHAVDFNDLVLGVITLWEESPRSLEYWRRRFAWIQVDEVQDTSRAEYRILDALGREHKRLSFFGDVDQTIYEWRGSAPVPLLAHYKAHYDPLIVHYEENFRSTRRILEVCERVITSHPAALTQRILPQSTVEGEPVARREFASSRDEYEWLAREIPARKEQLGIAWRDIAVLVRTNFTARDVSEALEIAGVPHVRVEEERFFQRAEIKCAVAHLRLLENPQESSALYRFLETPPKGIGEATLAKLAKAPREWALRLSDVLKPEALRAGDPHGPLIEAWHSGKVTVLDTETTGLDPRIDEVVELAARRNGKEFYRLIRPGNEKLWPRLEEAARIHGVTRERLEAEGVAAAQAFTEFAAFLEDSVVAGHNLVAYDWPFLERQSGGCLRPRAQADTLELSRRLLKLNRYRLSNVVEALQLSKREAHHAMEDVKMTEDVLAKLVPMLEAHSGQRREVVTAVAGRFEKLALRLADWRERAHGLTAAQALDMILHEAEIRDYFARQENGDKRLLHLGELERIAASLGPQPVPALLEVAALGLDLERQLAGEDKVRILTVHQAKGLEFECVFVAKAVEGEFPSWRSQKEGRLDEEHRLFYVAVSRAKQYLAVSYPKRDGRGRGQVPSRYLAALHS